MHTIRADCLNALSLTRDNYLTAISRVFRGRRGFDDLAMTPPIPADIRNARVKGYRNVYELLPHETRLYGTESLYGDWNGRLLLLAKDFACSSLVQERIDHGCADPYRHAQHLRTNKLLIKHAAGLTRSTDPVSCGILYGSALASLLRDDSEMSGNLPNKAEAMDFGVRALRFTLQNMPNLQVIGCLGQEAWQCVCRCLDFPHSNWKEARDTEGLRQHGSLTLIPGFHPAARTATPRQERFWELVVQATTSACNLAA